MRLYDEVCLKHDVPEYALRAGMVGVVVAIFEEPDTAYEVEFSDECGRTLIELALKPESIDRVSGR